MLTLITCMGGVDVDTGPCMGGVDVTLVTRMGEVDVDIGHMHGSRGC